MSEFCWLYFIWFLQKYQSMVELGDILLLIFEITVILSLKNLIWVLIPKILASRHQDILVLLLNLRTLVFLNFSVLVLYVKKVQNTPQSDIILVTFGGWFWNFMIFHQAELALGLEALFTSHKGLLIPLGVLGVCGIIRFLASLTSEFLLVPRLILRRIKMLECSRHNLWRRWVVKPTILAFFVCTFELLSRFKSSFGRNRLRILKQQHFDLTESLRILHVIINLFLLFVTVMLSELFPSVRVLIEIVHLIWI